MSEPQTPLCVDLDGSLVRTDLFWESLLLLLRRNPLGLLLVPFWLLKGRACLKRQLALRAAPDPALLPYDPEVLEYVRRQERPVHLATASDQTLAESVARHLGGFGEVHGSSPGLNLKGAAKAARLAERFGERGFDYLGDSAADLHVWARAREALVVSSRKSFVARVGRSAPVGRVFAGAPSPAAGLLRALRPHQWVKNVLVFLPMVAAHRWGEPALLLQALLAFASFSLCASAVYVINDLLDVEADRRRAGKRLRPFASGALPLRSGPPLAAVLLLSGLALGTRVNDAYLGVLGAYFVLTCVYSFGAKRMVVGDVILLAGLYTLRIFAGGAATEVPVSDWLLAFSLFFFLSLAFLKRFTELQEDGEDDRSRGYAAGDRAVTGTLGAACGLLSVLILSLYLNRPEVTALYARPARLWLACPVLVYWVSRVWILAHRRRIPDDPVLFAIRDPASWAVSLLLLLIMRVAV